ncbi:MAG TPA: hypothetical protein V6D28_25420 [Leptolyngbyaceae cyanobacterium]
MNPGLPIVLLIVISLVIYGIWRDAKDREGIDRHLLAAVKGNKSLAKRLLAHAKERYPGKSERWYAEKVIYDLERDRAGGRGSPRYMSKRELRENLFLAGSFLFVINGLSTLLNRLFGR